MPIADSVTPLGTRQSQEQTVAQHKTSSKPRGNSRVSNKSMKKAAGSRRTKSSDAKRAGQPSAAAIGDEPVTIDRRRTPRRADEDQSAPEASAQSPKLERREKVNRRRQIDPTTCERDYTEHEVEFMNALDDYKRQSGRMFPTCSEVLEVVRSLGYVKTGTDPAISCSAEPFVAAACQSPAAPQTELNID
jgi:hypothetical protein